MQKPLALMLSLTIACTLAGCGKPAEDRAAEPAAAHSGGAPLQSNSGSGVAALPAIHAVLAWESLLGGENLPRKNYRARMQACKGAGMQTRELSPEEEARLGTGEVEILIDARRQTARLVHWTLGAEGNGDDARGTCLARLEQHIDQSTVEDNSGMYESIDEDNRARQRQLPLAAGWKLAGDGQASGQPCTRWDNGRQEVCMWSGGLKWGFSEAPVDVAGCTVDGAGSYLDAIPLDGKPLQGGNGCVMRTKSFTLREGLNP